MFLILQSQYFNKYSNHKESESKNDYYLSIFETL